MKIPHDLSLMQRTIICVAVSILGFAAFQPAVSNMLAWAVGEDGDPTVGLLLFIAYLIVWWRLLKAWCDWIYQLPPSGNKDVSKDP